MAFITWADITNSFRQYFIDNSSMITFAVILIFVGVILIKITNSFTRRFFDRIRYDETVELFLRRLLNVFLWSILIIVVLGVLGFDVRAFIAGLGVMGFIVGFAVKDILANLAAGVMLVIYKPFRVGDDVDVGGIRGIVTDITISLSIITSEKNIYVAVPNARIWGNPIKNYSRLAKQIEKNKKK